MKKCEKPEIVCVYQKLNCDSGQKLCPHEECRLSDDGIAWECPVCNYFGPFTVCPICEDDA